MSGLYEQIEAAGHQLQRDEDGEIDIFVLDYGTHNGPGCVICGDSWCYHCPGAMVTQCDGGERLAKRKAKKLAEEAALDLLEACQAFAARFHGGSRADTDFVASLIDAAIAKATTSDRVIMSGDLV
jgi:hypothetical protein